MVTVAQFIDASVRNSGHRISSQQYTTLRVWRERRMDPRSRAQDYNVCWEFVTQSYPHICKFWTWHFN